MPCNIICLYVKHKSAVPGEWIEYERFAFFLFFWETKWTEPVEGNCHVREWRIIPINCAAFAMLAEPFFHLFKLMEEKLFDPICAETAIHAA